MLSKSFFLLQKVFGSTFYLAKFREDGNTDGGDADRRGQRERGCAAPNIEPLFAAAAHLFKAMKD